MAGTSSRRSVLQVVDLTEDDELELVGAPRALRTRRQLTSSSNNRSAASTKNLRQQRKRVTRKTQLAATKDIVDLDSDSDAEVDEGGNLDAEATDKSAVPSRVQVHEEVAKSGQDVEAHEKSCTNSSPRESDEASLLQADPSSPTKKAKLAASTGNLSLTFNQPEPLTTSGNPTLCNQTLQNTLTDMDSTKQSHNLQNNNNDQAEAAVVHQAELPTSNRVVQHDLPKDECKWKQNESETQSDEDDGYDDLFCYGKNKAPPPKWEGYSGLSSKPGPVEVKEKDRLVSLTCNWDEGETEATEIEEFDAQKCSAPTPLEGRPKLRQATRDKQKDDGSSTAHYLHELAEKDKAAQRLLHECSHHAGDLDSVKQFLSSDTNHSEVEVDAAPFNERLPQPNEAPPQINMGKQDSAGPGQGTDSGSNEDARHAGEAEDDKIRLAVDAGKQSATFRLSKSDGLQKLFDAAARKFGLPVNTIVFRFDGEVIVGTATPDDLGLEDEDKIDAIVTQ